MKINNTRAYTKYDKVLDDGIDEGPSILSILATSEIIKDMGSTLLLNTKNSEEAEVISSRIIDITKKLVSNESAYILYHEKYCRSSRNNI